MNIHKVKRLLVTLQMEPARHAAWSMRECDLLTEALDALFDSAEEYDLLVAEAVGKLQRREASP